MQCPHCNARAIARSSKSLSPVFREITFVCRNLNCGHVFVAGLEAIRTLSPASIPNPDVDLPLSRSIATRELANQMRHAQPVAVTEEP